VERDGKSLLKWIRIHFLKGLPGLAGPELKFSRTPTVSDKSSHLRCWRLRSADQLPTGLVLSEAPGPHLQMQAASRFKLKKGTHNNRGINNFKTNNTSNILIVLSKIVIILFRIL
jgi:hypothetical protein